MSLTIELTPEHEAERRLRVDRALQLEGVLSDEEAEHMQAAAKALREHWR